MPDSVRTIAQWMERTGKSPEDLIPITQQRIVKAREDAKSLGLDPGALIDEHQAVLDAIERLKGAQVSRIPSGHMYEVNVHADPEHFLHWDKPLSEQHPVVKDATKSIAESLWPEGQSYIHTTGADGKVTYLAKSKIENMTGAELVNAAKANGLDPAAFSQRLSEVGIPGIRYLDANSRSAGEGTHNLVVFSPETMDIIRRYGIGALMAGGGAAAATQQQPNALQQQ